MTTTEEAPPARRGWNTKVGMVTGLLVLVLAAVAWGPALLRSTPTGPNNPLSRFLLAVAVVLLIAHLCGAIARRLGQPPVLGEIIGGLLLGPSALGLVWPAATRWLFPPDVLGHVDRAAQLGLVVFMFLLGCELRTEHLRGPRTLGFVVAGSMGLPLLAGIGIALSSGGMLAGAGHGRTAYVLFLGLAIAITAMPVLGRILIDLKMDGTPLGVIALSAAAIGDGIAWMALALILAADGDGATGKLVTTGGLGVAFVLFVVLCVRPALAAFERWTSRRGNDGNQMLLAGLVIGAVACGAATDLIGLHPVIGAFLFGTVVPRHSPSVELISRRMQGFAVAILLPLFFAGVGLSTSVALLGAAPMHWVVFVVVLLAAVLAKIVGAGGGARLAGLSGRDSLQIGTLMNCRGITELVVATIGLQAHLINRLGFTILVLVAVITTAATSPLMRRFAR